MSVELRSVRRLFSAGVTRLSASDGPGWHLASVGIVTAGRWFVGGFGARCNHGIIYMTVRLAPHGRAWHGMAWHGLARYEYCVQQTWQDFVAASGNTIWQKSATTSPGGLSLLFHSSDDGEALWIRSTRLQARQWNKPGAGAKRNELG